MNRIAGMLLAATMLTGLASAAVPKNALGAVAVSPDGATVVAAGDNRVLYVVDPASLEVKSRVHLGINPQEAVFSKDGATLAVWDTDGTITFYNVADWSVKTSVKGAEAIAFAPGGDVVAALGRPANKDSTPVTLYALSDGSKKAEGLLTGAGKSIVAAPDGSSFAVLTERKETADETKQSIPSDVKGLARTEFEMKNDGFASEVIRLDAGLKETGRTATWYSGHELLSGVIDGDTAWFAGYSNKNLKITGAGESSVYDLPTGFAYGFGVSPDGKTLASGALRNGGTLSLADGAVTSFKLENEGGWPEYFEVFAFAPDGSVYGGTTAYRLIHVAPDGTVKTAKPIY